MGNGWSLYANPDIVPRPDEHPKHDPKNGFQRGRQRRVMLASVSEMESAKLKPKERDYCAHKLLEYRGCRAENWPFPVFCSHERHAYLTCESEDYVIRMKEYERERRLMERDKRIESSKKPK